jgi:hypothetical protein
LGSKHVIHDIVKLLSRHGVFNFGQALFESSKRFLINLKLSESMVLVINMISIWSWLSCKFLNIKRFLVILCNNINDFDDFHILIVESALVLLDSELVAFSMLIDSLVNSKLLNLSIFFLNIMPNNVASSSLEPGVAPGFEIFLNSNSFCGSCHMLDEIRKFSVLE